MVEGSLQNLTILIGHSGTNQKAPNWPIRDEVDTPT